MISVTLIQFAQVVFILAKLAQLLALICAKVVTLQILE